MFIDTCTHSVIIIIISLCRFSPELMVLIIGCCYADQGWQISNSCYVVNKSMSKRQKWLKNMFPVTVYPVCYTIKQLPWLQYGKKNIHVKMDFKVILIYLILFSLSLIKWIPDAHKY